MDLKSALELLEISDVSSIKAEDLKQVRKRAMRRWHPDRIAHTNPAPELVEQYEQNFKNIDAALDEVEAFLRDGVGSGFERRSTQAEAQAEPEDIVTRNAPDNQSTLRSVWPKAKAERFEFQQEDVVVTEGVSIQAALDEDLNDRVPAIAVFALGAGFLYLLLALLGGGLVAVIFELMGFSWIGNLLLGTILLAWCAQAISCLIVMTPLSRFWMPPQLADVTLGVVNATQNAARSWLDDEGGIGKWAHGLLSVFAFLVHWLIAFPLFKLAGLALKERRIGRNVVTIDYYAGYSGPYLERLMNSPVDDLTIEELFDLSAAVSRFKAFRPQTV